jgi:hypothetical protein
VEVLMTAKEESLVPIARAAELLGGSYAELYGAGLRGHIRLRRLGRRVFVPLRDLEEFAEKRGLQITPNAA